MEHNIVLFDDVEHKAVDAHVTKGCHHCSLNGAPSCDYHPCHASERDDETNVVYKRHYRPKHSELINVKVLDNENGN